MRWRLIIEEFNPELHYIKGERNIVADALSRLDIDTNAPNELKSIWALSEHYANDRDDLTEVGFPLKYKDIQRAQQADVELLEKLRSSDKYATHSYRGGGKRRDLIVRDGKIVIPQSLKQRVIDWYHVQLCHPGLNRTEMTINQHFTWKGLRDDVAQTIKKCPTCQKCKKHTEKYGHVLPKEAECDPWEILCVDLVGPYTIATKNSKEPLQLWAVTMIDPATGWFEMTSISKKMALNIANKVEISWLM